MKRVFDTYMLFFQVNQSAAALKHVFASLRLFVCKVREPQLQRKGGNHCTLLLLSSAMKGRHVFFHFGIFGFSRLFIWFY